MAHSYQPPLPPRWNRNIRHGWVEFKSGADDIRGYLARPRAAAKAPAIVLVHENIGVIPHRREVTRKLAEAGFGALTVDLYSRVGGQPPQDFKSPEERRQKAFLAANDEQAIGDLEAGCRYLKSLEGVDGARIGALGYCMGGGTLFAWMCGANQSVKAAVVYYGTANVAASSRPDGKALSRLAAASKLQVPLQVHHGEADQAVPFADAKALVEAIKKSGQPVEFFSYPGANHAFEDDTHPNYHAEATAKAWERMLAFFGRHLGTRKAAAAE
jgi:carboxymethylenebutenolidase